jgi:hypothetical protein
MGYFKRPIRRGPARLKRLAFLNPTRGVRAADWRQCDPAIPPQAGSFLRFVVERPRVGKVGLFRWSRSVDGAADVPAAAQSVLRATFRWFNANLPVPRRLPRNAICWFRADANESLARLRTLVEIYRLVGYPVWVQATRNPGRVVYRDEYQVAAVPYPDRRTTAPTAT